MKKTKVKIIFPIFIAVIIVSAAALLCLNPHYLYITGEYLGTSCKKVEITETAPKDIVPVSLDELKARSNIEFDQSLMLINTDYPIDEDFAPEITEYKDTGVMMNEPMQESYAALSSAVSEKFDTRLYVASDFRTWEQQAEEYADNPSTAIKPGSSEHQAGLALDLYVKYYAGEGFIKSQAGQFVNSSCYEYGFIIRYPSFGKNKTGIGYEPWHIRYVGTPHAKIIYNNHLTLEEYILSFEEGVWYRTEGYLISRQRLSEDNTLNIPQGCESGTISPDNTGKYIITLKIS